MVIAITIEQVCDGHSKNTWVISEVSVNITFKIITE